MAKKSNKRIRISAKDISEQRSNSKKDHTPKWEGSETWPIEQYRKHFHESLQFYNLNYSSKDLKPQVIMWMNRNNYTKKQVEIFKQGKDWRTSITMGAVASCLLKGMPSVRKDFNGGKSAEEWLVKKLETVIGDSELDKAEEENTVKTNVINIQDRLKEVSAKMAETIEDTIEQFQSDPENFDPKSLNVIATLKSKGAKSAHARIIKGFYEKTLSDLEELSSGSADDQLREAYSHRSKKQIRKLIEFLKEVESACNMLSEEAKVTRKPRKVKAVSKEKLVSKLKYKKSDDGLKLVSINPIEIVGCKELWIYNTKTRKLGKYVADDYSDLSVKGTTIINYNETKSVQKTLRKPVEQLKAFKDAGKVALRKFLEDINAVDIKMNGRLNIDTLLLKVG